MVGAEQGLKWITEIESANHVVVVRYNDPAYLAKLVSCLREGHTLVVTNIEVQQPKETLETTLSANSNRRRANSIPNWRTCWRNGPCTRPTATARSW